MGEIMDSPLLKVAPQLGPETATQNIKGNLRTRRADHWDGRIDGVITSYDAMQCTRGVVVSLAG